MGGEDEEDAGISGVEGVSLMTSNNEVLMRGARGSEHRVGGADSSLFFFTLAGHRVIWCVSFPREM